jgi:hypothetical protein
VFRRITVQSKPGQIAGENPSQKNPIQKRTDKVAQHVGLSSNSSTAKKKKKKNHFLFLSAPCNLPNTAAICLFLSMSLPSSCTLR